jgi:hypothetical protein
VNSGENCSPRSPYDVTATTSLRHESASAPRFPSMARCWGGLFNTGLNKAIYLSTGHVSRWSQLPYIWPRAGSGESGDSTEESAMQFTFIIADFDDAKRLEDDLRRDPRIYTRRKKANGQNNVGKEFRLTQITVDGRWL